MPGKIHAAGGRIFGTGVLFSSMKIMPATLPPPGRLAVIISFSVICWPVTHLETIQQNSTEDYLLMILPWWILPFLILPISEIGAVVFILHKINAWFIFP